MILLLPSLVLKVLVSAVNLAFRPYSKSVDYAEAMFAANEVVKKALDKHNIEIPFPQRDLNIRSGNL